MSASYHHGMLVPQPLPPVQAAAGSAAAPGIGVAGDPDTGLFAPAADTLAVATGGAERLRVDAAGALLVGQTVGASYATGASPATNLQIARGGSSMLQLASFQASASGAEIFLSKSRAPTVGGNTAAQSGDNVGGVNFDAATGSGYARVARLDAFVDGVPGAAVPGRIAFSTTADGGGLVERMRITSIGNIGIGTSTPGGRLHVTAATGAGAWLATADSNCAVRAWATSVSYVDHILRLDAERAPGTAYNFLLARASASTTPDVKFKLAGDGNAYADGAWTGGGADYAEFFEWLDGNPDAEDRRGLTVVLEGDRIRPATAADGAARIIGVVGATPTIVGDAAWNHWSGKHRRDEYGAVLSEEYEVVEWEEPGPEGHRHGYAADAVPVGVAVPAHARRRVQRRPVVNPAFDPNRPYQPRAERREWAVVGLMGKLRLRLGQPTGDRWVRLRPVTATVEEWLVR